MADAAFSGMLGSIGEGISQIVAKIIELGPMMVFILIWLAVAFLAIKTIQSMLKKFFKRVQFNEDVEHLAVRATGWVLWFLVLMWLVGQLGLESVFESLLAVGALGGLAVALAVKDSLKDVVSGVLILQDRHFDLGDRVKTAGTEGKIIDVSLRKTRILKDDGSIAIVPNARIDTGGWEFVERRGKRAKDFAKEKAVRQMLRDQKAKVEKMAKLTPKPKK